VAPSVVPTELTESDLQSVLAQDAPQVVQFPAQIGKCLPITGLGPELSRDRRSILQPPGSGNQQAGQGKRSRRSGADIARRFVEHRLCTTQPDDQHRDILPSKQRCAQFLGQQFRCRASDVEACRTFNLEADRDGAKPTNGPRVSRTPLCTMPSNASPRRLDGPCSMTGPEEGHRSA
jgi:hypothetical protein